MQNSLHLLNDFLEILMCYYHMTLKELLCTHQIAYATGTHEQRKGQCHA